MIVIIKKCHGSRPLDGYFSSLHKTVGPYLRPYLLQRVITVSSPVPLILSVDHSDKGRHLVQAVSGVPVHHPERSHLGFKYEVSQGPRVGKQER